VRCPGCEGELQESAPTCSACGADARFAVRAPDGGAYGPYTLDEIRRYAGEGRIVASAVLVSARGETFTLSQAGIVGAVPYVTYIPPGYSPTTARPFPRWAIVVIVLGSVVVIGAVVAAILYPLTRRTHPPHQVGCLGNLKQLELGMLMYAADYDDFLPREGTWRSVTYPYVKNASLYECPSSGLGQQSYEFAPPLSEVKLTSVKDPPGTAMLYDAGAGTMASGPHNGGYNVGFADGHVKWLDAVQAQGAVP